MISQIEVTKTQNTDAYISTILQQSLRVENTIAQGYLQSRSLEPPYPSSILFHPRLRYEKDKYYPAIISTLKHDVEGHIVGIQRVYLAHNGLNKAKVTNPRKTLGCIRYGACCWLTANFSHTLILTEGVEDGLSATYFFPKYDIVAFTGVNNAKNFIVPDYVSKVIILFDNDEAGRKAADNTSKALNQRYSYNQQRPEPLTIEVQEIASSHNDLNETLNALLNKDNNHA